jgi:hypothetical protein
VINVFVPAASFVALVPLDGPIESSSPVLIALAVVACLFLLATVLAAWVCALHLKAIEKRLSELDRLSELKAAIQPLVDGRGELDLRRLEHVLIDIRDGQRRVEERLLTVIESSHGQTVHASAMEPIAISAASAASSLADRVVTRLLALGYERVQVVTPRDELAKLVEQDGDILVEARRDGAPCKGHVSVRGGRLADVQIQAAYSAFP